jgi:SPP1 gp7 family putative phage head morphogenesis protein
MAGWKVSGKPVAPKAAIDFFKNKKVVDEDEWDRLEKHAARKAFKIAGVTQMQVVQQVHDAIDTALKDGTTIDEFKKSILGALVDSWGGEKPGRVETIFRTNMATAYSAGRQQLAAKVKATHPYFLFDGVDDDRQTDECADLDGTILHQDDPFWEKHTPPMDYNCRSQLIVITGEDMEAMGGETDELPDADPGEGFGGKLINAEDDDFEPQRESFDHELFATYEKS